MINRPTTSSLLFRGHGIFLAGALLAASLAAPREVKADDSSGVLEDDVVVTEKARAKFLAGVDLMQDPDGARYAEAYRAFKDAYAESPSWKILGNLGITAMKLERDGEAIEALQMYLDSGRSSLDEAELQQVERDLRTLKASVVWVTITADQPGAYVTDIRTPVAGAPVSNRYDTMEQSMRIGVRAGQHQIKLELAGYEAASWHFDASGGDLSHDFQLKKLEEETAPEPVMVETPTTVTERPVTTATWVTLGSAGALAVGATVTGILALDKKSQFDDVNGTDPDEAESLRKSGQALNVTTDILAGAAIVTAGVAAYLYFTRPEVSVEQDTGFIVAPSVSSEGGGLWLHGSF